MPLFASQRCSPAGLSHLFFMHTPSTSGLPPPLQRSIPAARKIQCQYQKQPQKSEILKQKGNAARKLTESMSSRVRLALEIQKPCSLYYSACELFKVGASNDGSRQTIHHLNTFITNTTSVLLQQQAVGQPRLLRQPKVPGETDRTPRQHVQISVALLQTPAYKTGRLPAIPQQLICAPATPCCQAKLPAAVSSAHRERCAAIKCAARGAGADACQGSDDPS